MTSYCMLRRFLDVRFAEDIYMVSCAAPDCFQVVKDLELVLVEVRFILNVSKTVGLRNEAQPPRSL